MKSNKKRALKRTLLFPGLLALGLLPILEAASFSASGVTLGVQHYNSDNQLVSSGDGTGQLISYQYDSQGRIHQVTTRDGNHLCAYYNAQGLETESFSTTVSQGDCPATAPATSELAQYKNTVVQTYDPLTRKLLTEDYSVGQPDESDHTFTYYTNGQLKSESDGKGHTLSYSYDNQHRLLSVTAVNGATISYTYTYFGRVASSKITLPDGSTETVNYTYTPYGNLKRGSFSDGVRWSIGYDEFGRPISKQFKAPDGNVVYSISQTFSNDSQVATRDITEDTSHADQVYSYNDEGQLTQMTCNGDACPIESIAGKSEQLHQQNYTFNNLGEIKSIVSAFSSGTLLNTVYNYQSDHPNQLTSITSNGQPVTLNYDKDGNITKLGATSYTYNAYDKMTSAQKGNNDIQYTYHGNEGLASRQMNGGDTMSFVYSLVGLLNILHSNGQPAQTLWRGGLQSVQDVFTDPASSGAQESVVHYFTDTTHAPFYLLEKSGSTWKGIPYVYSDYGQQHTLSSKDTQKPLLGFDGELQDPVTGDVFFNRGERVYNPKLRLFMQHDFLSPFKTSNVSGYDFANNDPINGRDPSGHLSTGAKIGIEVGVGLALLALAIFTLGILAPAATAAAAADAGVDIAVAGEVAGTTDAIADGVVATGYTSTEAGLEGGSATATETAVNAADASGLSVGTEVSTAGEGSAATMVNASTSTTLDASVEFGATTMGVQAVNTFVKSVGLGLMSWGATYVTTGVGHAINHDQNFSLGKDSINAFITGVGDFVGAGMISPAIDALISSVSTILGPALSAAIDGLSSTSKIILQGVKGLAIHVADSAANTVGQTALDNAITNHWDNVSSGFILDPTSTGITGAALQPSSIGFELVPAIGSFLFGKGFSSPLKALTESASWGRRVLAYTSKAAIWVGRDVVRRGLIYRHMPNS